MSAVDETKSKQEETIGAASSNTVDRALDILGLFTMEAAAWTVDAAAGRLGCPTSTMYRYFRSLVRAGLLVRYGGSQYVLGPMVLAMDRQIRHLDPLIKAASIPLRSMVDAIPLNCFALLCRLYEAKVICTMQVAAANSTISRIYERGSLMPLFKGACSLAIASYVPRRTLRRYYEAEVLLDPEKDANWRLLRTRMRAVRNDRLAVTHGELAGGFHGVAAPIFDTNGEVFASIGVILTADSFGEGACQLVCERVGATSEIISRNFQMLS